MAAGSLDERVTSLARRSSWSEGGWRRQWEIRLVPHRVAGESPVDKNYHLSYRVGIGAAELVHGCRFTTGSGGLARSPSGVAVGYLTCAAA